MRTYWWKDVPNWGDRLGPLLLEYYCGMQSVWSPVESADIVVTGSVLEHIPGMVARSYPRCRHDRRRPPRDP